MSDRIGDRARIAAAALTVGLLAIAFVATEQQDRGTVWINIKWICWLGSLFAWSALGGLLLNFQANQSPIERRWTTIVWIAYGLYLIYFLVRFYQFLFG
jgi:hypothetical protein